MKNHLLITGASKGLGKAIAELYQQKGYEVISFARTKNPELENVKQIECDLSQLDKAITLFSQELDEVINQKPESISLINNAGSLGKINKLEEIPLENIQQTVSINYTAPLLLSSLFIKKTKNLNCVKKIRTISSGAAKGAYHGWSVYCSTKAAADSFTSVIGVEQASEKYPVHAISIYPGVVDTGMQSQIRDSSESEFANVERFKQMKADGDLAKPEIVAQTIYRMDQDASLENGQVISVREY